MQSSNMTEMLRVCVVTSTVLMLVVVEARPSFRDLYGLWRPLDLVRGLRSLSMDPYDVYRALDAVKDLDSEEALDFMHGINLRPVTIYDALSDLSYDPFDAYYALKAWLTDPDLRPKEDPYNRVNITGDPKHPYLHVSYGTDSKDGKNSRNIQAKYLTSKELDQELEKVEEDYRKSINEDRRKMSDFIEKSKRLHTAFDDPKTIFEDFFGKRHFKEWKSLFPEAFKSLKNIYRNPLGERLNTQKKETQNETVSASNRTDNKQMAYDQALRGLLFRSREDDHDSWLWQSRRRQQQQRPSSFDNPDFNDPKRYDKLQDETNVEEEDRPKQGAIKKTHHVKRYFDKLTNMYVECKKTEECEQTPNGVVRRVKSFVKHVGRTEAPQTTTNQTNKQ